MRDSQVSVSAIIVHYIEKTIGSKARLTISKEGIPCNDVKTIRLVTELNERFKNNITYGVFSDNEPDNEFSFQTNLTTYLSESTDESLVTCTTKSMSILNNRIDAISQAKGGYLVFTKYIDKQSRNFFAIFFIRDKKSSIFKRMENTYTIEDVDHLDTDKLAMACRLNLDKYSQNDGNYLGFISIRQPEASDYFIDWLGVERKETNDDDSNTLLKILNKIDLPINSDGSEISREELKANAYNQISAVGKLDLTITALSSMLFHDETKITTWADENLFTLNTEFKPNLSILKKLIKSTIDKDRIKLTYPSSYYGDKIRIDRLDPNIVIIESKESAEALRHEENYG